MSIALACEQQLSTGGESHARENTSSSRLDPLLSPRLTEQASAFDERTFGRGYNSLENVAYLNDPAMRSATEDNAEPDATATNIGTGRNATSDEGEVEECGTDGGGYDEDRSSCTDAAMTWDRLCTLPHIGMLPSVCTGNEARSGASMGTGNGTWTCMDDEDDMGFGAVAKSKLQCHSQGHRRRCCNAKTERNGNLLIAHRYTQPSTEQGR